MFILYNVVNSLTHLTFIMFSGGTMVATRSFKLVLLLLCSLLTFLLAKSAPNQQKDTYNYDEYFVGKTIVKNAVSKGAGKFFHLYNSKPIEVNSEF